MSQLVSGRRERELNSIDADWLLSRGLQQGGDGGSSKQQQVEVAALQQRHDSLVEMLAASKASLDDLFTTKRATAEKLQVWRVLYLRELDVPTSVLLSLVKPCCVSLLPPSASYFSRTLLS